VLQISDWLATNKGLAPGGHGIVGAAQGGTAALAMAEFHPDRFRYAGSMSGFLDPSNTFVNGAITAGLMQYGNVDTRNMWGLPQLGRWKWHDPDAHIQLLADNNTRLWVFSPSTLTCSDPPPGSATAIRLRAATDPFTPTTGRWAAQRALRHPCRRPARLGDLGSPAGRHVRRSRHHYQVSDRRGSGQRGDWSRGHGAC
jgi:S-formylglutathione hydrolase FrmB